MALTPPHEQPDWSEVESHASEDLAAQVVATLEELGVEPDDEEIASLVKDEDGKYLDYDDAFGNIYGWLLDKKVNPDMILAPEVVELDGDENDADEWGGDTEDPEIVSLDDIDPDEV